MDEAEYESYFERVTGQFSAGQFEPFHRLAIERMGVVQDPRKKVLAYFEALDQVLWRFDKQRFEQTIARANEALGRSSKRLDGAFIVFNDDERADRRAVLKSMVCDTSDAREAIANLVSRIREDFGPDRGPQRGGGRGFER